MRMIEKVARAIAKKNGSASYMMYMGDARAAIEAMREPDEAMLGAGARVHDHWAGERTVGGLNAERNACEVFRAMIDKALESGE